VIRFQRLAGRPDAWDEAIRGLPGKTLFHESAWLDHVLDIHPAGDIAHFELLRDGERVGYHCGLEIRKLLLRVHGSPLGGTGTNHGGPLAAEDVPVRELVKGLSALVGLGRVMHLEVSNPRLDYAVMREAGFAVQPGVTHVVQVPGTEEEAWQQLRSAARNRVRKARDYGLVVEVADNEAIVDQFFEQFTEVYGKQGMVTPFGIERPRSLFRRLAPAGRLLPLRVRLGDEVLATGLFPWDEHCIYFWGAASWVRHHRLCPNEALHWKVLQFAVEQRIPLYNMCGGTSQFKNKFGGDDVPHNVYHRSAHPLLRRARERYRAAHFRRLQARLEEQEA
jgi:hypothetical protein